MRTERNKYLLSICLLALYVVFQAGISVFPHEHDLNGEKLVHSHPYSNANHTHTSDQAVTIARLSSVQTLVAETSLYQNVELPVLCLLESCSGQIFVQAPHTRCVNLRAPPYC